MIRGIISSRERRSTGAVRSLQHIEQQPEGAKRQHPADDDDDRDQQQQANAFGDFCPRPPCSGQAATPDCGAINHLSH